MFARLKQKIRPQAGKIKKFARRRPLVFSVLCLVTLFAFNIFRFALWPPVWPLAHKNPQKTSFMEYRAEEWEEEGREVAVQWTWKDLDQISPHLQRAVVVSEDSTFWTHGGFDWAGMRVAFNRNVAEGRLSAGGSTISQQLAKNLYFSPKKSLVRKAQEALVTWRLERALEKKRLLEIYLNVVEWGDGIYGAEAAARHYFKTSAARLSRRQAATLAAMLPNPHTRKPGSRVVRKISGIILRRMR